MKGWRSYFGVALVLCLLAGLTSCKGAAGPNGFAAVPTPDKPKVADKAKAQEALTALDQELTSILKTLEDLDLVDEEDLIPQHP